MSESSQILEAMKTRRSCRAYKSELPEAEKIDAVVEAGLWAASGMGKQSPIILKVTNKELRDRLSKLNAAVMGTENDPFYGAPAVLVVLADRSARTYLYDGSLAMGNMMLAAHAEGLGSCWIHRAKEVFESEEGKKILADLGVEGDYEGIGNCILGYAAGELPTPDEKPRREGRVIVAE